MSLALLLAAGLLAQAPAPLPTTAARLGAGGEPEVHFQNDEVFAIGEMLRCPVCQGMPIAESPSTMAQDMMKRVREMSAEGKSRDEILDYFVARYGEWVLLEPKHRGFGLLVWVLPPLGLVIGVVLALMWISGRKRGSPAPEASGEASAAPNADPFLDAIRREVDE